MIVRIHVIVLPFFPTWVTIPHKYIYAIRLWITVSWISLHLHMTSASALISFESCKILVLVHCYFQNHMYVIWMLVGLWMSPSPLNPIFTSMFIPFLIMLDLHSYVWRLLPPISHLFAFIWFPLTDPTYIHLTTFLTYFASVQILMYSWCSPYLLTYLACDGLFTFSPHVNSYAHLCQFSSICVQPSFIQSGISFTDLVFSIYGKSSSLSSFSADQFIIFGSP